MRSLGFLVLVLLAGCGKPLPPPAAASAPIAIDGTFDKLDAVESDKYLHYAIGTNIAASPDDVWAVLTKAEDYPKWNSTVTSLEGTIAKDEQIELKVKISKRTFKLTVSTFEPGKKLVWEDGNNAFKGVRTFTLTDKGDGTTDFTMKEAFSGSMMKMIAPKLPDFGPDFDAFAADLKKAVESR